MSTKETKGRTLDAPELEAEISKAMRAEGWLLPETVAEVLAVEKSVEEEPIEVSDGTFERLRARLQRPGTAQLVPLKALGIVPGDFSVNLARAAREGGEISPEIELRMKRDREAAEAKKGDK